MIGGWLTQHRLALSLVLSRIRKTRMATLVMMGVIGVTLSLPAILYVAIDNLQRMSSTIDDTPQITLFLASDTSKETLDELQQRLKSKRGVASFRFVDRDTAWHDLQQQSGLQDVVGELERNPLPDAFVVTLDGGDPDTAEHMQQEMQQWEGVELSQLDAAWLKRLQTIVQLGRKAITVIAALLGFALLVITGNSIRLQIVTQIEEIELSRLIGATDRFIRRPFLYAGTLYGLGGGLASLLILSAATWLFNLSVAELAAQYASDFRLTIPVADILLMLVGGSALLGWISAYWAVNRSLAALNPTR